MFKPSARKSRTRGPPNATGRRKGRPHPPPPPAHPYPGPQYAEQLQREDKHGDNKYSEEDTLNTGGSDESSTSDSVGGDYKATEGVAGGREAVGAYMEGVGGNEEYNEKRRHDNEADEGEDDHGSEDGEEETGKDAEDADEATFCEPSVSVATKDPGGTFVSGNDVLLFLPASHKGANESKLRIRNLSSSSFLFFKLQSNTGKRYAVTPAGGVIAPENAISVSVHLKDRLASPGTKDKFLVRCTGFRSSREKKPLYDSEIWSRAPRSTITKLFVDCLEHPVVRDIPAGAAPNVSASQPTSTTSSSIMIKEKESKSVAPEEEEIALSDSIASSPLERHMQLIIKDGSHAKADRLTADEMKELYDLRKVTPEATWRLWQKDANKMRKQLYRYLKHTEESGEEKVTSNYGVDRGDNENASESRKVKAPEPRRPKRGHVNEDLTEEDGKVDWDRAVGADAGYHDENNLMLSKMPFQTTEDTTVLNVILNDGHFKKKEDAKFEHSHKNVETNARQHQIRMQSKRYNVQSAKPRRSQRQRPASSFKSNKKSATDLEKGWNNLHHISKSETDNSDSTDELPVADVYKYTANEDSNTTVSAAPRETKSSRLRRRVSHSRSGKGRAQQWVSANRRNTFIGQHRGTTTTMGGSARGRKWGGKHTIGLNGGKKHKQKPGSMRPPWLGRPDDADTAPSTPRVGLSRNLFVHPGQTNSSLLRQAMSSRNPVKKFAKWIPASGRGHVIKRDKTGLFSRTPVTSGGTEGSGQAGGSDMMANEWPSSADTPVVRGVSKVERGVAITPTEKVLMDRLVEYEGALETAARERRLLLDKVSKLQEQQKTIHETHAVAVVSERPAAIVDSPSTATKPPPPPPPSLLPPPAEDAPVTFFEVTFTTPLGIEIAEGMIITDVEAGSAAETLGVKPGDVLHRIDDVIISGEFPTIPLDPSAAAAYIGEQRQMNSKVVCEFARKSKGPPVPSVSVGEGISFNLIPVNTQASALPQLSLFSDLIKFYPSDRDDEDMTVGDLKKMMSQALASVDVFVSTAQIEIEADDIVLYDSWQGTDFGLGVSVKEATYSIRAEVESTSPSHPVELDGKRTKNFSDHELSEFVARVHENIQGVKECCGDIQAAVGATFGQVSRDLEIFVRHVLCVCETAPFTSHPAAAIEVAKQNNPLGFKAENQQSRTLTTNKFTDTPGPEHRSMLTGGDGQDSCARVRVICSLNDLNGKDDAEYVATNSCINQVDERVVRLDGGMVPKTFVFDKVVNTNDKGGDKDSSLGNAISNYVSPGDSANLNASRHGSFCVVSMGGLDHDTFGNDLGPAYEKFLSYRQDSTTTSSGSNTDLKEDVCITAVEIMGEDNFRDLLEPPTSPASKHGGKVHRLQSDSSGHVWVTDILGVAIKSRMDFERVCRIVHERRSRISLNGTLEYLHDHAEEDANSAQSRKRESTLQLPIHPLSHIILSIEAVERSDREKRRALTIVALASGVVPRSKDGDEALLRSSVASSLRRGISVCQKTLSAMQHVLLSIAAAKDFHTFRHSRLTYLLQRPLTKSDVIVLLIGVPTSLEEQERSSHLLNIGKRVIKKASKARVNSLLVTGHHSNRRKGANLAWR